MATTKKTDGAHKTLQPSPELGAVVGNDPLKRTEVVSKVWTYIKAKDLQNPKDKREILADEPLQKVFGKKAVSMFEIPKFLNQHLK